MFFNHQVKSRVNLANERCHTFTFILNMLFQYLCQWFFKQPKTLIHDTNSLNLPSFILCNASSSQYFLSPVTLPPACSALACPCTSPEGRCPNQCLDSRRGLPSAKKSPSITVCFLQAVGNLGWVLTWLFHCQFQNYLIPLDISGCCHAAKKAKSFQRFSIFPVDLSGFGTRVIQIL